MRSASVEPLFGKPNGQSRKPVFLLLALVLCMGQTGSRGIPVDFQTLAEHDAIAAGSVARIALKVTLPEGLHVNSNAPRDESLIATALAFDLPPGIDASEVVYPAASDLRQEASPIPLAVFERQFVVGASLRVGESVRPGMTRVRARFRYQACDDRMCYRPVTAGVEWTLRVVAPGTPVVPKAPEVFAAIPFGKGVPPPAYESIPPETTTARSPSAGTDAAAVARLDEFEIRASEGGYLSKAEFLQFVRDAEAGVRKKGLFEDRGPLAILAIVFLGGLALNLTPCVLPMIPINLAIIGAGARGGGGRGRGLWLGASYGAAMAVVYGVLGLVVILTAGTFGTINASPWFNAGIAALFVVLGLAMFDILTIDFSRLSSRIRFSEGSRGSFLLAFGMGAIAALLAGACVAPVVIQVVLFASNLYATGNPTALALPFVLGLGMALPWPIAGAGFAALPKPGAWMVKVKYVIGVFILGTAVYYAYTAYTLFANRWVDPLAVSQSVDEKIKSGWHASLAEGLMQAERDRTPVLIDLWATWCKNCLVMDQTTLADPEVIATLSRYTRIKFQAEDPSSSPARELMDKLGAVGLPTYVILQAR